MFDAIPKTVAVPRLPALPLATVGTVALFGWLLAQGQIHPIVIFLLQLFLAF